MGGGLVCLGGALRSMGARHVAHSEHFPDWDTLEHASYVHGRGHTRSVGFIGGTACGAAWGAFRLPFHAHTRFERQRASTSVRAAGGARYTWKIRQYNHSYVAWWARGDAGRATGWIKAHGACQREGCEPSTRCCFTRAAALRKAGQRHSLHCTFQRKRRQSRRPCPRRPLQGVRRLCGMA